MRIDRAGDTPSFYDLGIKYALVPLDGNIDYIVKDLIRYFLIIPPFQRGIAWRRNEVEGLLTSESKLFGNVILARVEESAMSEAYILVDGLQRFATATALLEKLYPLVLSPNPIEQTASKYFETLERAVSRHQPVFSHNNKVLLNHERKALIGSYQRLVTDIENLIKERIHSDPKSFAEQVRIMFIDKQVAIDPYRGFTRNRELTNTFINLNSQGVDLTDVDLLRSELVNKAFERKWSPNEIEEMENDFTEVFTNDAKKELGVLGKIVYDVITKGSPEKIFHNWSNLTKDDIDRFFTYISTSVASVLDRPTAVQFPYLNEIFECGALPFAITLLYFYWLHLKGKPLPDFSTNDTNTSFQTDKDCYIILRSCYRRVIDGTIGRLGDIANNILQDGYPSLNDMANEINPKAAGSLDKEPSRPWLIQRIKEADPRRSRRIFNACLLPDRNSAEHKFEPLRYSNSKDDWQIDHLIPKALVKKFEDGEKETDMIINLAPLRSTINKQTKALPCSIKLSPNGSYPLSQSHPYVNWLVNSHYNDLQENKSQLDQQHYLAYSVGEARLNALTDILSKKL